MPNWRVRPSVTRRPPGSSAFSRWIAPSTSSAVTPRARIVAASSHMRISRSLPPTSSTEPTPGTRCNRSFTSSSAKVVRLRMGMSPDRRTDRIGAASGSTFSITGGSESSGRSAASRDILSRTSCALRSASSSSSNSRLTMLTPSALIDRIWRKPAIVLSCSSMTSVTSVSMVPGEAPGRAVVTETYGNSTSGKRSTPSRLNETKPSTTSEAISIVANTGRRIETSASHISACAAGSA